MELPNEVKHAVMVPLSPVGFMKGEIVHGNEILVLIGEGYFVKRTAKQAREMIDRRQTCKLLSKELIVKRRNDGLIYFRYLRKFEQIRYTIDTNSSTASFSKRITSKKILHLKEEF